MEPTAFRLLRQKHQSRPIKIDSVNLTQVPVCGRVNSWDQPVLADVSHCKAAASLLKGSGGFFAAFCGRRGESRDAGKGADRSS
jgi:hypothetical protein